MLITINADNVFYLYTVIFNHILQWEYCKQLYYKGFTFAYGKNQVRMRNSHCERRILFCRIYCFVCWYVFMNSYNIDINYLIEWFNHQSDNMQKINYCYSLSCSETFKNDNKTSTAIENLILATTNRDKTT